MPFRVMLTNDAARDLEELYDYIALHDAPRKADYVLDQIEKAFSKLSEFPERGACRRVEASDCVRVLLGDQEPALGDDRLGDGAHQVDLPERSELHGHVTARTQT